MFLIDLYFKDIQTEKNKQRICIFEVTGSRLAVYSKRS